MKPQTFRPGDTTYLRSGGPAMTVSSVRMTEDEERVSVVFFTTAGEMVHRIMRAEMLDPPNRI